MFGSYGSSKKRVFFLAAMLMLCVVGIGRTFGQTPGDTGTVHKFASSSTLIFHIMDWGVIAVLVGCSVAGVAIAVDSALRIRESKLMPPVTVERIRSLIEQRKFKELIEFTATDDSFVSQALHAALRRAHFKYGAMLAAMENAVSEQSAILMRRIELLNLIGNTGPLIGLLGTVLGMIIAFYELGASSGQAKPSDLAVGISTALWHTFGGLAVAIPSMMVFGFYRNKADRICTRAALVAEEMLESLRPADGETTNATLISGNKE